MCLFLKSLSSNLSHVDIHFLYFSNYSSHNSFISLLVDSYILLEAELFIIHSFISNNHFHSLIYNNQSFTRPFIHPSRTIHSFTYLIIHSFPILLHQLTSCCLGWWTAGRCSRGSARCAPCVTSARSRRSSRSRWWPTMRPPPQSHSSHPARPTRQSLR